ncbi:DUF3515 domain-containing protein [Isoptericola sp. NEAU-Y5]|uniref:DUF3515 domain-containing protein n=1 Tax=Isoptericola luteus TaxID=2879484 RepID=A0ABS7ZF41_9MICO|nr:DUF3515 family protein [Isoptericola sp. NEAU-Y5]MCA5893663.1 DUF3515 domain-containing protein [Isoptericola sp. NEAU-Y5]
MLRPPTLRRPRSRRAAATLLAALAVVPLAACAPTIGAIPAEDAANPACAPVMLAMPETLAGDLVQRQTDAQATTAWGEPGAAVTLRCGVTPPGPSADCQSVESAGGTVDWIVEAGDDGTWRFTTYGREPAVEVLVPPAVTESRSTSFIGDLAQAVGLIEPTAVCT